MNKLVKKIKKSLDELDLNDEENYQETPDELVCMSMIAEDPKMTV